MTETKPDTLEIIFSTLLCQIPQPRPPTGFTISFYNRFSVISEFEKKGSKVVKYACEKTYAYSYN